MTIEEIRNRKKELGYTAAELAGLAGIPVGTLQKILSGETKCPRYATRQAIERVLMPETGIYASETASGKKYPDLNRVKEASSRYGSLPDFGTSVDYETSADYGPSADYGTSAKAKATLKKQGEYRLEDYHAWPKDQRIELIDGVIYEMVAPSFIHQRFISYFSYLVQDYIYKKKGTCIPMVSPVDVKLDCDDKTMLQPDALILCDKSKIRRWGIEGAPDFILEVLSDSTRKKDLTIKMKKYLNAGVKEYWILDPREKMLYIYDFRDEGIPAIYPLKGQAGVRIYDEELKIPLDDLAAMFEDLPEE